MVKNNYISNFLNLKLISMPSKGLVSLRWVLLVVLSVGPLSCLPFPAGMRQSREKPHGANVRAAVTPGEQHARGAVAVASLQRRRLHSNSLVSRTETQVTQMRHVGRATRRNGTEDAGQTLSLWQEWATRVER